MARVVKIPALKIEFEKDSKITIHVPYDQKLIKKKMESTRKISMSPL